MTDVTYQPFSHFPTQHFPTQHHCPTHLNTLLTDTVQDTLETMIVDAVVFKKRPGRLSLLDSHLSWTPDGSSPKTTGPELVIPFTRIKGSFCLARTTHNLQLYKLTKQFETQHNSSTFQGHPEKSF